MVVFQLTSFGMQQYFATARTTFEISGRIEVDSLMKLPTSSRNDQFSTSSSTLISIFTPTQNETFFSEIT